MTREEAIRIIENVLYVVANFELTVRGEKFTEEKCNEAVKIAIQAIEKEPCEDCISRSEAIRIASGYCAPQNIAKELRKLPPVTPQPKWIPVSEKLPEDGTEIFAYLFDRPSPYIAWIEDTHWYTEDFEIERENEPVAWMPLPEPYQAESEGKE